VTAQLLHEHSQRRRITLVSTTLALVQLMEKPRDLLLSERLEAESLLFEPSAQLSHHPQLADNGVGRIALFSQVLGEGIDVGTEGPDMQALPGLRVGK
jgi:hypothetical protein